MADEKDAEDAYNAALADHARKAPLVLQEFCEVWTEWADQQARLHVQFQGQVFLDAGADQQRGLKERVGNLKPDGARAVADRLRAQVTESGSTSNLDDAITEAFKGPLAALANVFTEFGFEGDARWGGGWAWYGENGGRSSGALPDWSKPAGTLRALRDAVTRSRRVLESARAKNAGTAALDAWNS